MKDIDINKEKLANILNMSADERYLYFIRKVVDFEKVWGLFKDGWALLGKDNNEAIPFWPEEVFAEICIQDQWKGYSAKSIPLDIFKEKWILGMKKDKKLIAIFYVPTGKGVIVDPDKLGSDIGKELEQYE